MSQASQKGLESQEEQRSVDVPPHMSHTGSACTTSWAGGLGMEDRSMEVCTVVGLKVDIFGGTGGGGGFMGIRVASVMTS